MFDATTKGGCVAISLKYQSPDSTFMMVFTKGKNKKKDTFHIISGLKRPKKLTKIEFPNKLESDTWLKV